MTAPPADRELLEAFIPEFLAGLVRLDAAATPQAAGRVLDGLRAMAMALGLDALSPGLEAANAATEPFDQTGLQAAAGLLRQAMAALTEDAPPPGMPNTDAPRRVLVVDDSPTMRRMVRGIIEADAAFTIAGEAQNGAEALTALERLDPALILLDLEMPVLDGVGFLHRWALAGRGKVVVVSSAAPPGTPAARQLRRLGVSGVVGKPAGALSFDLAARRGDAILAAARDALGLPPARSTEASRPTQPASPPC
jgi:CheY-like chemotaxis protein